MSSPSSSITAKSFNRIRQYYPKAFMQCTAQAATYAQCLEQNDLHNIRKNICDEQFQQLKICFQKAMKNSAK
ncbi:uncharacterized protein LOC142645133 [Dermatophagoides pteronyssinus]|uniref:IMS import disulfide relay-system CHCH-CHCH-like Cx9C domain-containing protein n=1 Tax=Dermatophagoides pteronyssinus TaxID=6956 RepID=A0ABQ8J9S4_DERPT|nr:hypothetical protein DERP_005694 [Dermatophagoides pteronyssinus]